MRPSTACLSCRYVYQFAAQGVDSNAFAVKASANAGSVRAKSDVYAVKLIDCGAASIR